MSNILRQPIFFFILSFGSHIFPNAARYEWEIERETELPRHLDTLPGRAHGCLMMRPWMRVEVMEILHLSARWWEREARSVLSCHTECEWTSNLYILPTYQRICAFFCCCCCRSARWRAFIFAALTTFLAHNPFIIIKTDAQNAGMAWVSACADEEMCQEPAAGSNNVYSSPFFHFVFFFFVQQRFMAVLTFSFCWFRKLSTFFCYLSLSVSCMACALHRPAIRDEGMKQKISEMHKQHALSNGSISFWYAIQQQHENW